MNRWFCLLLIGFLTGLVLAAEPVLAVTQSTVGGNLMAKITPENPGPNENVTIVLSSYSADLDRSLIVWRLNGSTIKSGTGEKQFSFKTGAIGSTSMIEASVSTNGAIIKHTAVFNPATVSLLWQADSLVPKGYRGKALFGPNQNISIIALPELTKNKTRIADNSLIYEWSIDGKKIPNASGVGKKIFNFSIISFSESRTISVKVSSSDGSLTAENSINITPRTPKLVFYNHNPLLGPSFNKALQGNLDFEGEEITILGQTFFTNNTASSTNFSWFANGQKIDSTSYDGQNLTLRRNPDDKGESTIRLDYRHLGLVISKSLNIILK